MQYCEGQNNADRDVLPQFGLARSSPDGPGQTFRQTACVQMATGMNEHKKIHKQKQLDPVRSSPDGRTDGHVHTHMHMIEQYSMTQLFDARMYNV